MKRNTNKNSGSLFVMICTIFPLTTFTQTLFPFPINRILATVIIILLIYMIINKSMKFSQVIIISYLVFIALYTFIIAQDFEKNFEDFIYFSSTILLITTLLEQNAIIKITSGFLLKRKFVRNVIFLSEFILIIALSNPECYLTRWGDEKYFTAWSSTNHALASASCTLVLIIILYFKEDTITFLQVILIAIPSFCILQSGARVFLLTLVILVLLYVNKKIKKTGNKVLALVLFASTIVYAFYKSNMYDKIIFLLNNPYNNDLVTSFTSGRSNFWFLDIKYFATSSILYKILGQGFDNIYRINDSLFGLRIWAHNDIINLLISIGLIGSVFYIVCWILLIKELKKYSNYGYEKKLLIFFILYLFIPMLLNGLYSYVHFIIGIPFLIMFLNSKNLQSIQEFVN